MEGKVPQAPVPAAHRMFQIIVFTCRPGDYLNSASMVPDGLRVHRDIEDGFVRAIDLARILGQQK
jgi:hypothetical protein